MRIRRWIRCALSKLGEPSAPETKRTERLRAERLPYFNVTAPAERNDGLIRARPTINWMDEFESPHPPERNEELRELVDKLAKYESEHVAHLVERVYFGGASSHAAARELGLLPHLGERLLKQGLARLRDWLENGAPKGGGDRKRGAKVPDESQSRRGWETLDEAAMETTMRGRYRGDARRLDAYVLHDPVEDWEEMS